MTAEEMSELVRGIVAEVLVVPREFVQPDTSLVAELGAESLDFLDLVFRLEESLGVRIPVARWDAYVVDHVDGHSDRITPALVQGFAREVREGTEASA